MTYFWLALGIVSFIFVTYKGITIGFEFWLTYYLFPLMAFSMFFFKKWMIKRMNKHIAEREEAKRNK